MSNESALARGYWAGPTPWCCSSHAARLICGEACVADSRADSRRPFQGPGRTQPLDASARQPHSEAASANLRAARPLGAGGKAGHFSFSRQALLILKCSFVFLAPENFSGDFRKRV